MGKPTGFLEYERKTSAELAPKDRIKNFNEFHTPLSRDEQRKQAARCMDCGVPFCQAGMNICGMTSGCPLNNLIPEWNDMLYNDNLEQAFARLSKTNCFPEFTSRVCPALCEKACTCNLNGDPVSVRENERAIIEYAFANDLVNDKQPKVHSGKKVAVILSIHELDLAERVSDWVLCVSPGQESQFGRPEEMLTPEHLSELFQVEEGRFRQTGGSMELPRPEGAPEVFVLAGGGSGRAVFWQLQRAGTTFAAGIVSEADLDYPAACTLASRLIAVPAFEEISEEKEQEARECLDACQCVIACRRQYGGWAAANDRLLAYAREKGKKIEYHNLPLHKMQ